MHQSLCDTDTRLSPLSPPSTLLLWTRTGLAPALGPEGGDTGALAAAAEGEGPDLSLLVVLALVLPDAPGPDPARLPGAGLDQSGDPRPALWLGAGGAVLQRWFLRIDPFCLLAVVWSCSSCRDLHQCILNLNPGTCIETRRVCVSSCHLLCFSSVLACVRFSRGCVCVCVCEETLIWK
ncbi:uncharacterized protein LOC122146628 isoform X3 [Cyprinus carpio]|uniref:Uncharacterized protein LOC122146628 isoform X3 n=1 Tax=Cyprinus carpio TaxID=7962 RepID=A0A9R0B5T2_CYPCA|nr:uncharacterized protein LOC122146628 isoform X3 [Cyprinus carpio]